MTRAADVLNQLNHSCTGHLCPFGPVQICLMQRASCSPCLWPWLARIFCLFFMVMTIGCLSSPCVQVRMACFVFRPNAQQGSCLPTTNMILFQSQSMQSFACFFLSKHPVAQVVTKSNVCPMLLSRSCSWGQWHSAAFSVFCHCAHAVGCTCYGVHLNIDSILVCTICTDCVLILYARVTHAICHACVSHMQYVMHMSSALLIYNCHSQLTAD